MIKHLINNYHKYPLMRIQDFFKLIFQTEYGVEHCISKSIDKISEECSSFQMSTSTGTNLFDVISDDLVRINLRPYLERGYSFAVLEEMMHKVDCQGSVEGIERSLSQLKTLVGQGMIDFTSKAVESAIEEYRNNGYGAVRHSTAYRLNYNPHYRVVCKKHAVILPLIARIDNMLNKKLNVIIAIDGMCGSGKSFYADVLSEYYDYCQIIRCDDFFLPEELATKERLSVAGGNIHHERLVKVLANIRKDKPFTYEKFNCKTQSYSSCEIVPKRLTILEGSYSLNSALLPYIDLGAIMTVNAKEQKVRLCAREQDNYINFINKWIPLENLHLSSLNQEEYVVIDTSNIKYK